MQMSELFTKSFVNKEDAYTIMVKEKFKVLYTYNMISTTESLKNAESSF